MAVGISSYVANKVLDCVFNNTTFTGITQAYIQLHIGDPGSAGTSNQATETTRKAVSCAAAASGAITSDADIVWTSIAGSQDATHFSLWDATTSGNFLGSGTITANAYTAGDTFTIPAGDFDVVFSVAS
jgi:hypothetical protein